MHEATEEQEPWQARSVSQCQPTSCRNSVLGDTSVPVAKGYLNDAGLRHQTFDLHGAQLPQVQVVLFTPTGEVKCHGASVITEPELTALQIHDTDGSG